MPLLLLIRHGENNYTKKHKFAGHLPGVHLNERGLEQARQLGKALKDVPITAVYSSPLERAMETAAPIASAHALEIHPMDGLIETGIGKWQGRSHKSVSRTKAWKIVQSFPSRFRFPDGESFLDCQSRVVTAIESIIQGHKPEASIACVFHADPIKLAVAYYLGIPIDNFQRLGCDTGSLTALYFYDTGIHLSKLNQRPPFDFLNHFSKKQVAVGSTRK